jgi:hypothetical protein
VPTASDQRFLDLCTKVIATQDSEQFQSAIEELRAALQSHIASAREKARSRAADLRLIVNNSKSNAA